MNKYQQISLQIRLYSGLTLMFYTVTHLFNHSLGVFGIAAMNAFRDYFLGFWRAPLIEWVVPIVLLLHIFFALQRFFISRTMSGMTRAQWSQFILGLLIPVLLFNHIAGTKVVSKINGYTDDYSFFYFGFPAYVGIIESVMLIGIWVHGCLGVYFYFRLKPAFIKWKNSLRVLAWLIPLTSLLGIWGAYFEAQEAMENDPGLAEHVLGERIPDGTSMEEILALATYYTLISLGTFLALLVLAFTTRYFYLVWKKKNKAIQVSFPDQIKTTVFSGTSILDASIQSRISHAHICGGQGRCSTCRVRIDTGLQHINPPTDRELRVLAKIGAPPNVRLACQSFPQGPVSVHPLLHSGRPADGFFREKLSSGEEREVVILFSDIRGFTSFSEKKLPYDLVFILNQYFQIMGHTIEENSGYVDKFIGDGIMAIFGMRTGIQKACKDALEASRLMCIRLEDFNRKYQHELENEMKMGIGLHLGKVILGEVGYGRSKSITAIGDAVNTASRFESLTKEYASQLIFSEEIAAHAAFNTEGLDQHQVQVRGREALMNIYSCANVSDLASATDAVDSVGP